jgi:predicted DNA-binding ArsR family transcriptional regulator
MAIQPKTTKAQGSLENEVLMNLVASMDELTKVMVSIQAYYENMKTDIAEICKREEKIADVLNAIVTRVSVLESNGIRHDEKVNDEKNEITFKWIIEKIVVPVLISGLAFWFFKK